MATAIGFFGGEGSTPGALHEKGNKELVKVFVQIGMPVDEILTALTHEFVNGRFNSTVSDGEFEDCRDGMVIVAIIADDGDVCTLDRYEEILADEDAG